MTFMIGARVARERGIMAILIAVAVGTMRIQNVLELHDCLYNLGIDTTKQLYEHLGEYVAQIEAASLWLAADPPEH